MMKISLFPLIFSVLIFFFSCTPKKNDLQEELVLKAWSIQSSDSINASGDLISSNDFDAQNWYSAKVPETVLHTLVQNGVYKDIYLNNNLEKISLKHRGGTEPDLICKKCPKACF